MMLKSNCCLDKLHFPFCILASKIVSFLRSISTKLCEILIVAPFCMSHLSKYSAVVHLNPVVAAVCTGRSNSTIFYILPAKWNYMFCMDLKNNQRLFLYVELADWFLYPWQCVYCTVRPASLNRIQSNPSFKVLPIQTPYIISTTLNGRVQEAA